MAMVAVGRKVTMAAVAASKKCSSSATSTSLAKRLGDIGMPPQHVEGINEAMTECLKSLVSKVEMQRFEMLQESKLYRLKSETQSSQEHNFGKSSHKIDEMGKKIEEMRNDLEKLSIASKEDRENRSFTLMAEIQAGKYELGKFLVIVQVSMCAVAIAALHYLK